MIIKYLKQIALFLIPLLVFFAWLEFSLREIPNDYQYKHDYLNKNAEKIKILILGSSHSLSFIKPQQLDSNAFSAAQLHQTLRFDKFIFDKFKDRYKSLHTIILPVSYGTFFSALEYSKDKWRIKDYRLYFEFKEIKSPKYLLEVINGSTVTQFQSVINYMSDKKDLITCDSHGFGVEFSRSPQTDMEKIGLMVAKRHTRECSLDYYAENLAHLESMIQDCQKSNIKVVLYTSPSWPSYYNNLQKDFVNKMYEAVNLLQNKYPNVKYKDYLKDSRFGINDFRDADHLNETGAIKFTGFIKDELMKDSIR